MAGVPSSGWLQWNFCLCVDVDCGNLMCFLLLVGVHTVSVDTGSSTKTCHESGLQYTQNLEQKCLQWSRSSYLGSCLAEWGLWGGDGRTSALWSFQQYQVMFYKFCFLFSSALVKGYKISQIIFKREPFNATGGQRAISLHTHHKRSWPVTTQQQGKGGNFGDFQKSGTADSVWTCARNLVCVFRHLRQVMGTYFKLPNMYLGKRIKMLCFSQRCWMTPVEISSICPSLV